VLIVAGSILLAVIGWLVLYARVIRPPQMCVKQGSPLLTQLRPSCGDHPQPENSHLGSVVGGVFGNLVKGAVRSATDKMGVVGDLADSVLDNASGSLNVHSAEECKSTCERVYWCYYANYFRAEPNEGQMNCQMFGLNECVPVACRQVPLEAFKKMVPTSQVFSITTEPALFAYRAKVCSGVTIFAMKTKLAPVQSSIGVPTYDGKSSSIAAMGPDADAGAPAAGIMTAGAAMPRQTGGAPPPAVPTQQMNGAVPPGGPQMSPVAPMQPGSPPQVWPATGATVGGVPGGEVERHDANAAIPASAGAQ